MGSFTKSVLKMRGMDLTMAPAAQQPTTVVVKEPAPSIMMRTTDPSVPAATQVTDTLWINTATGDVFQAGPEVD